MINWLVKLIYRGIFMENENKQQETITIDGKIATRQQLNEQIEKGKHFTEDKDNPGNYRTLQKMRG